MFAKNTPYLPCVCTSLSSYSFEQPLSTSPLPSCGELRDWQVRHLTQEEQRRQAEKDQAEEAQAEAEEQANNNDQEEDEQVITQPLLTDRDELSPRGRQVSASFWADNDDPSDGKRRRRPEPTMVFG